MEDSFESDSEVNVAMITSVKLVKNVARLNGVSTCEWNRNVCSFFFRFCFLPVGSDLFCAFFIECKIHGLCFPLLPTAVGYKTC